MISISKINRPVICFRIKSSFGGTPGSRHESGGGSSDPCPPCGPIKPPGSDCPENGKEPCILGPSSEDNKGAPTIYDCRKLGHKLSTNDATPTFETLQNIPTGVFRNTTGEVLGLGAAKCCYYQNPEFFSYHHMSFYDLNIGLRQYRLPSPKTGRKPN